MKKQQNFENILLMGRHRLNTKEIHITIKQICNFLQKEEVNVWIEEKTAEKIENPPCPILNQKDYFICDLIIVIGGDGNMLNASHLAVAYNIPVLGINRGRLGFLTDIAPNEIEQELSQILQNNYSMEQRFLLQANIYDEYNNVIRENIIALNDVVLLPNELAANMISFSIYINNEFVCEQRADGLIVSTPTGSTEYALSGGGPILHPNLDAITLVPMFPHTLSTRPIVIPGDQEIKIEIDKENSTSPRLSCDGQRRILISPKQSVAIKKHHTSLTILHPLTYNYFQTLRAKLRWH
ncbi:MAG: NAD(+) kinase [Legionellales bacterium]|nr:NAD(+) kinase [Legionellales bacterium]